MLFSFSLLLSQIVNTPNFIKLKSLKISPVNTVLVSQKASDTKFENTPITKAKYSDRIAQLSTTSGTTYYISPSGKDSNQGTSATSPWRSISKVNSVRFKAGDHILFEGGATFTGKLYFDAQDVGLASNPIVISSYGSGAPAIIESGTDAALFAYNTGGYYISNLKLVGSGATTNTSDGISFYNDLAGNIKLDYIYINNVNVSGFRNCGIAIGGWNNLSAYRNVSITNSASHDNGKCGVLTYAQTLNANENIYVGRVRAYRNLGIAGDTNPTGNGIVLGNVKNATIERSVAYENGGLNNAKDGPVGIWTYDSTNVTIQYNESYNNRTGGKTDGGGFDLDQNVSNSVMQYNYSHDNDGAGFLMAHSPNNQNFTGNVVRYNVSENDGRKNNYAAIDVYGRVRNSHIYNNTVYLAKSSTSTPVAMRVWNPGINTSDVSGLYVRNNIFLTPNNLCLVKVTATQLDGATNLRFEQNNYYSTSASPKICWGATAYTSLDSWRQAANQEQNSSGKLGMSVNPLLTNPGNGGTVGDADQLSNLSAYRLQTLSPLRDLGLNLPILYGVDAGDKDFYGSLLPQGASYSLGANE